MLLAHQFVIVFRVEWERHIFNEVEVQDGEANVCRGINILSVLLLWIEQLEGFMQGYQ